MTPSNNRESINTSMMSSGLLLGDGLLFGDGLLPGDNTVGSQSVLVSGDVTSCMK